MSDELTRIQPNKASKAIRELLRKADELLELIG